MPAGRKHATGQQAKKHPARQPPPPTVDWIFYDLIPVISAWAYPEDGHKASDQEVLRNVKFGHSRHEFSADLASWSGFLHSRGKLSLVSKERHGPRCLANFKGLLFGSGFHSDTVIGHCYFAICEPKNSTSSTVLDNVEVRAKRVMLNDEKGVDVASQDSSSQLSDAQASNASTLNPETSVDPGWNKLAEPAVHLSHIAPVEW